MRFSKVDVYKNLHKGCWSVRWKGRVKAHEDHVLLCEAKFHVSQAGRARVQRQKRKNVHAWIKGTLVNNDKPSAEQLSKMRECTYDPYKYNQFVDKEVGSPLQTAELVWLSEGRVYYWNKTLDKESGSVLESAPGQKKEKETQA
jgi:hypothetical protein